MGVGSKIKEYRIKTGLTQKDLADKLHVTYQAVSRWENDDAEPSIDTLKDMCVIFGCSTDQLFGIEQSVQEATEEKKPEVVEKVIIQEARPVLAVCEVCNKPIYDGAELFRIDEEYRVRNGRASHMEHRKKVLCASCNAKRIIEEKRKADIKERTRKSSLFRRRIHSFIWPTLIALLFIIVGIANLGGENNDFGLGSIIVGVLAYFFSSTLILNNTFVADMWLEMCSWGCVKFPGIIFSFDIGGFVFLILMKILFFFLGIIVAVFAVIFATVFAMAISTFVYPFALGRNLRYKD